MEHPDSWGAWAASWLSRHFLGDGVTLILFFYLVREADALYKGSALPTSLQALQPGPWVLRLLAFVVFSLAGTTSTLSSFWQFQRMVKHITGRSAFFSYYGYGCYCGLGGRGVPVDATDR